MAGIKRSHDYVLVSETASAPSDPSTPTRQGSSAASRDNQPPSKKLKGVDSTTHSFQELGTQGNSTLPAVAVSPKVVNLKQKQAEMHKRRANQIQAKKLAAAERAQGITTSLYQDQEMSDASSSDEGEQTQAVPATHGVIHPFTPLPHVRARNVANNRYAPTAPAVQAGYIKEVGQLQLHPSRHPMQTPNSRISVQVRHAIYERHFLGRTNEGCIPTWNSYGGKVSSAAAISKVLLRDTGTWFAEMNTVLPWMARKNDDKDRLKQLGMLSKHFPAPHVTTATPANGVRARHTAIPGNQPSTDTSKPGMSGPSEAKASHARIPARANTNLLCANANGRFPGDDEDDEFESSTDDSDSEGRGSAHSGSDLPNDANDDANDNEDDDDDNDSSSSVVSEDELDNEPPMRALIMAATNAFALEEDSAASLVVGDKRYMVNGEYLLKHCGLIRKAVPEHMRCGDITVDGPGPLIMRAFIQAITPGRRDPKNRLPEYDFDFEFTEESSLSGWDDSDPVGVIDGDRRKAQRINWDVSKCIQLYDFATAVECNLVRNLVVDQLRMLYREENNAFRNKDRSILEKPEIPLYRLARMSLAEDGHFISVLGALHENRMQFSLCDHVEVSWPKYFSNEVVAAIEEWSRQEDRTESADHEQYCRRCHHHGEGEDCHMLTNDKDFPTTEGMITDLYSGLRAKAERQCTEAFSEFEEQDLNEIRAYNAIRFHGHMMQWAFRREEKVAKVFLRLERARGGMWALDTDLDHMEYCEREVIKCSYYLKKLRIEHWDRWNLFEEEWIFGDRTEEASRLIVRGDDPRFSGTSKRHEPSSEPLPWEGD